MPEVAELNGVGAFGAWAASVLCARRAC